MVRTHTGQFHGQLSHWFLRNIVYTETGEECEESSHWGGSSIRDDMWWTDHQFPISLCHSGEGDKENCKSIICPGRWKGWGEGVFKIYFISLCPVRDYVVNKFSWYLLVQYVLPVMVFSEGSLPVLISTHESIAIFSLPCPTEKGSEKLGGHLACSQRQHTTLAKTA